MHRPRLPETDARRPPKSSAGRSRCDRIGRPRSGRASPKPPTTTAGPRPTGFRWRFGPPPARIGQNGPRIGQNGPKALDSMTYGVFFPEWAGISQELAKSCSVNDLCGHRQGIGREWNFHSERTGPRSPGGAVADRRAQIRSRRGVSPRVPPRAPGVRSPRFRRLSGSGPRRHGRQTPGSAGCPPGRPASRGSRPARGRA